MNIIKERRKCGAVCPRCDAPKGIMCKADCPVNGDFIKDLIEILKRLNLQPENLKLLPIKEARGHIKQPPDHYVKDLIEILKRLNLQPENLKLLPIKEARAHIKQPDHDVNIYVGINKERGIKWD